MTRNICLHIAFDGSQYSGWQRQKNAATIQGTIEEKLTIMSGEPVCLKGAGRTDAGVHAHAMVANFHTASRIPIAAFQQGLNSMLPADIRIIAIREVEHSFHSRFDAKGKTYRYDFCTSQMLLPTLRLYVAHFPCRFNHQTVQACLSHLIGTHDFTSFEAAGSRDQSKVNGRGAIRTIHHASCHPWQNIPDHWSLFFTGDGFLRHMVRNIAGTLIEAGRGKISVTQFNTILHTRDRGCAGATAPACGLFLEKVLYDVDTAHRSLHENSD